MSDDKGKPNNNNQKPSPPPTTEYVRRDKEPNVNRDKNKNR